MGLIEIDGLFKPPSKTSSLLTDHPITGKPLMPEPAQEIWFKPNHPYDLYSYWFGWVVIHYVYLKHILHAMTS